MTTPFIPKVYAEYTDKRVPTCVCDKSPERQIPGYVITSPSCMVHFQRPFEGRDGNGR